MHPYGSGYVQEECEEQEENEEQEGKMQNG
jgi:hypothetical protein